MRLYRPSSGYLFVSALFVYVLTGWFARHDTVKLSSSYDWLQFNFDPQHSGNNTQETTINPTNVSTLKMLFQTKLTGNHLAVADGAPAYLSHAVTPSGIRSILFVTTMAGDTIAVDALTGEQLWGQATDTSRTCRINDTGGPCYTTSSPAVDPNHRFVYSYGLDGYVHKYNVGDGTEITTGGWPELTTAKPMDEKGSSALSIVTDQAGDTYLYITHAGYPGDGGDYQGHVTVINLASGQQHVFNALCADLPDIHFLRQDSLPDCSSKQAGIWGRPGVIYDPDTDEIYLTTGNGDHQPSVFDWGDSILALHPDGSGSILGMPIDSYTPANADDLEAQDADLGSASPALLPAHGNRHYAVQGGKDRMVRIIDIDDMSGQKAPGYRGGEVRGSLINTPQNGVVRSQPAIWTNPKDGHVWVLIGTPEGISGLPLNENGNGWGTPWVTTAANCSSPIVANGVMFCAGHFGIQAFDPATGTELWHDSSIGTIHWQSPIVANGVLYITDNSEQITAYSLGGTVPEPATAALVATPG